MALPQMAWISQCVIVHIHNCCAACSYSGRGCSDRDGCSTVSWTRTGPGKSAAADSKLYSNPDSTIADCDSSKPGARGSIRVKGVPWKGGEDLSVPIEAEARRLYDYRNICRGHRGHSMDLLPLQSAYFLNFEGLLE